MNYVQPKPQDRSGKQRQEKARPGGPPVGHAARAQRAAESRRNRPRPRLATSGAFKTGPPGSQRGVHFGSDRAEVVIWETGALADNMGRTAADVAWGLGAEYWPTARFLEQHITSEASAAVAQAHLDQGDHAAAAEAATLGLASLPSQRVFLPLPAYSNSIAAAAAAAAAAAVLVADEQGATATPAHIRRHTAGARTLAAIRPAVHRHRRRHRHCCGERRACGHLGTGTEVAVAAALGARAGAAEGPAESAGAQAGHAQPGRRHSLARVVAGAGAAWPGSKQRVFAWPCLA
jgi:hypothetical protein